MAGEARRGSWYELAKGTSRSAEVTGRGVENRIVLSKSRRQTTRFGKRPLWMPGSVEDGAGKCVRSLLRSRRLSVWIPKAGSWWLLAHSNSNITEVYSWDNCIPVADSSKGWLQVSWSNIICILDSSFQGTDRTQSSKYFKVWGSDVNAWSNFFSAVSVHEVGMQQSVTATRWKVWGSRLIAARLLG